MRIEHGRASWAKMPPTVVWGIDRWDIHVIYACFFNYATIFWGRNQKSYRLHKGETLLVSYTCSENSRKNNENLGLEIWIRERSQMTSSEIRGFQTPPPSFIFRHFCHTPLDDVIFYQTPPFFPRWFSAKSFMIKFKITRSGFSFEYYSKQKSIHLLLAEFCRLK